MHKERFRAWQLVRLRGRGPYGGSAWRAAAHIYRDRAINCMEAMRSFQESIHVWEDAYTELEAKCAADVEAERVAIERAALSIRDDYPESVFPSEVGAAARHAAGRILDAIRARSDAGEGE